MFLRAAIMPLLERLQDNDNLRHSPYCGAMTFIHHPMGAVDACTCKLYDHMRNIINMEMWVVLWVEPNNPLWSQYDSLVGVAYTTEDVIRIIQEHLTKRQFISPSGVRVSYDQLPDYYKSSTLAAYQAQPFRLVDVETDVELM